MNIKKFEFGFEIDARVIGSSTERHAKFHYRKEGLSRLMTEIERAGLIKEKKIYVYFDREAQKEVYYDREMDDRKFIFQCIRTILSIEVMEKL